MERKYDPDRQPFYLNEEERGILVSSIRAWERNLRDNVFFDDESRECLYELAESLLEYICEGE